LLWIVNMRTKCVECKKKRILLVLFQGSALASFQAEIGRTSLCYWTFEESTNKQYQTVQSTQRRLFKETELSLRNVHRFTDNSRNFQMTFLTKYFYGIYRHRELDPEQGIL
jgi:hypothetical protein